MTDLQDLILDRLVGAKLGVNLPDSPLRVAAELIGDGMPIPEEEFTGSGISEAGISVVARRLGLPVLVCEAFQGALHGIDCEEDRRRFAMSVFRLTDSSPANAPSRRDEYHGV